MSQEIPCVPRCRRLRCQKGNVVVDRSAFLEVPVEMGEVAETSGNPRVDTIPQPFRRASLTRTVVAGAVGNMLEWYDFGLFGYFAPVIARQFLPAEDPLASLLGTFGVFAAGFLMRPLGG